MSERARSLGLGERLEVEAAIENAFAPLRARHSSVGPTRVRAAVRWGRAEPRAPVRWAAAVSRISELGMAVGMSAFIFAAALTSVPPGDVPIPVTEVEVVDDMLEAPIPATPRWTVRIIPPSIDAEERFYRWLKLDRVVPIEDRIDATIPAFIPEPVARPDPVYALVLRMPTPLR